MYNPELEGLIDAALADGMLTEKEKQILFKKAQAMGVDLDEFEMVLDARLVKLKKAEQEKAASSAPKSNKLGDVKKCPACGAMVQSYQGVCPECGYAFEGMDANSAVKELSSLLQKTSEQDKMEKLIDTYPIPMEKASLLAFITWVRPQSIDKNNPLANSYFRKYGECVNKIRVSFSNDKDLVPFIDYIKDDEKKIKKQRIVSFVTKPWVLWPVVAMLIGLFFILKPTPTHKSLKKTTAAINNALKESDTQNALTIFFDYKGKGRDGGPEELKDNGTAMSLVKACLSEGNLDDALRVCYTAEAGYGEANNIVLTILQYCLDNGDLSTAHEIIMQDRWKSSDRGKRIRDVVTYLCEHGKKREAQKFLNSHISEIDRYDNLYHSDSHVDPATYVKNKIQKIINQY